MLTAIEVILSEEQKGERRKKIEQTQRDFGNTIKSNNICVVSPRKRDYLKK